MAGATAASMRENADIRELLELLKSPGFQTQRKEYASLLDGVDAIIRQYDNILTELDALKEKIGQITDRKNPLSVMAERLGTLAAGIGEKLKNLKNGIITFTKNALESVKEKGLSALGTVFGALHVRDGLNAMSKGLAKSVESLNKAVVRVENLESHTRGRIAGQENSETLPAAEPALPATASAEVQAVSLADLMADMRVDFENLTTDELKSTYEKLLAIGIDNDLTANENVCLQYLVGEAESLLPGPDKAASLREAENEPEQDAEI